MSNLLYLALGRNIHGGLRLEDKDEEMVTRTHVHILKRLVTKG